MAAFSIDTSKQTGGMVARAVRELRQAQATVDQISALLGEMDDAQILAATTFSGTAVTLRTTFANASTAIHDINLDALAEQLFWD